ncbi:hypothetical protein BVX97_01440 [bacterium E08(2017)]|nr:hypothetical protein BVX97_01440 [bacterium E08(2017)]
MFDAHCHLQLEPQYSDADGVMMRAGSERVDKLVCAGTSESDWNDVASLSNRFKEVIPSFGLHPWYVSERSEQWLNELESLLLDYPGSGVGEIGLDHAVSVRNDDEQEQVFREQLDLAVKLKRPISIHCVKAWGAMLKILREYYPLEFGFMIHAYSGSEETLREIMELDGYVSFADAHQVAASVASDRLLVETDEDEPCNMKHVVEDVAVLRGISAEELARQTAENASRLFRTANER